MRLDEPIENAVKVLAASVEDWKEFLDSCIIVDLNEPIKRITVELKQSHKIKLPDAIIAATSLYMNIPLISADKIFEKISELRFIKYEI